MEGEERNEHPEAEEQEEIDLFLQRAREGRRQFTEFGQIEGWRAAACRHDQPCEACEQNKAAEAEVDCDFPCGFLGIAASSHPDHEECRNERQFVKSVEEKEIRADKGTGCTRRHQENRSVVQGVISSLSRAEPDRREGHDDREQHHDEAHAIDAHIEADGWVVEQGTGRCKLEGRSVRVVEPAGHQETHGEVGSGGGEGGEAWRNPERHDDRRENRNENQQVEQAQAGKIGGSLPCSEGGSAIIGVGENPGKGNL